MLWKFLIGTLVLPCCLGLETASATLRKDVENPERLEELELLSTENEPRVNLEESLSAISQDSYKISHHKRRYRKRNYYQPRHDYQRRNHNRDYQRVDYYDNYEDCPEYRQYRRRRVNYYPAYNRHEPYPINDMIYRRHHYRRH